MISGVVLACGDCVPLHPQREGSPLMVILLIAALALLTGVIVFWQRRRRSPHRRVTDQWSALSVMGELCPDGWQAEITLYGWGAPIPPDAPPARAPLVEVEWKLWENDGSRLVFARRFWAETIDEALQAMVDDRRLDIMLEQIERSAGRGEDD